MAWEEEGVANVQIIKFFKEYLGRDISDEYANQWRLEHTHIVGGFLTNAIARQIIQQSPEGESYKIGQTISETDPWAALQQQEEKLGWQRWVKENGWQVSQLWERFTGHTLTNDELMLIASSGEGSAPYLEKIQKFQYWEPAYQTFAGAYGAAPTGQQMTDIMGKYQTPEQYGAWTGAEAQATAMLPKIQEQFRTELGKEVGKQQLQELYAGYATSGDFGRQLEEAKRRREYRWNQVKGTSGYERGPAGVRLADWY